MCAQRMHFLRLPDPMRFNAAMHLDGIVFHSTVMSVTCKMKLATRTLNQRTNERTNERECVCVCSSAVLTPQKRREVIITKIIATTISHRNRGRKGNNMRKIAPVRKA